MIDYLNLVLALLGGGILGLFYFGGLWMTVRTLPGASHPALLTMGSFLVRTLVVLPGLYFLMGGRVENLLVSMLGFLIARQFAFKLFRDKKPGTALL